MDNQLTLRARSKFYITTAINYTNGPPHFGHAYEAIVADVIARYHRIHGDDVFFMTGTDEHGQKVADAATDQGLLPIQLCDKYVEMFKALNKQLNIAYDFYIRTTMPKHHKTCHWIWNQTSRSDDIYLGEYSGWYSVREERFLTENEARETNYLDSGSGKPLIKRSESSYFFKMSKYSARLLEHIKAHPEFIMPEEHQKEVLSRLENEPLLDLSISRATFDWGVPVPQVSGVPFPDQKHVMYVWFDALTNYLSAVDYPDGDLARYWPADVHLIGKDIVWFHAVIWPCMLLSAGVKLPKTILCHGFVNGPDGRKMSKSYGNVIIPSDILAKYSADTLRFFVMTAGNFGSDFNFSEEALISTHDFELAANLGNLVQRVLTLTVKYSDGKVPFEPAEEIFSLTEFSHNVTIAYEEFRIHTAIELVFATLRTTNKYLTDRAPWQLSDTEEKKRVVRTVLEALYICAHFCSPVLPTTMDQFFHSIGTPMTTIDNLTWNNLVPGTQVNVLENVLFERIQLNRFDKKQDEKETEYDISSFDLVVGKILTCKINPDANHLYVCVIDIGGTKPIQVVTGLAKYIPVDNMLLCPVIVVKNMKPSKFRGVLSEGMLLTASNPTGSIYEIVCAPTGAKPGEKIKVEGFSGPPIDQVTKTIIDKVKEYLKTNSLCLATYKGAPLETTAGYCTVASLKDAQLG